MLHMGTRNMPTIDMWLISLQIMSSTTHVHYPLQMTQFWAVDSIMCEEIEWWSKFAYEHEHRMITANNRSSGLCGSDHSLRWFSCFCQVLSDQVAPENRLNLACTRCKRCLHLASILFWQKRWLVWIASLQWKMHAKSWPTRFCWGYFSCRCLVLRCRAFPGVWELRGLFWRMQPLMQKLSGWTPSECSLNLGCTCF